MASTPDNPNQKPENRRDVEQEMLMREVDDAVRTDEALSAVRKYGLPGGILLAVLLALFGGYLYWSGSQEGDLERQSETIVQALDELEAGNLDIADEELAALSEDGSPGARASAAMLRASIALDQGRIADAVALYDGVANDAEAPQVLRDASAIRSVAANFDNLDPQAVIDRLGGLAVPDNAWFGSAGELVAMAYLDQGKEQQAGPLLVQLAQDETVPATLRARTRQLAGLLGFDAVEDVEATMEELRESAEGAEQPAQ